MSQEYFCDGRVNCAIDTEPADESLQVCREEGGLNGQDGFPNSPVILNIDNFADNSFKSPII